MCQIVSHSTHMNTQITDGFLKKQLPLIDQARSASGAVPAVPEGKDIDKVMIMIGGNDFLQVCMCCVCLCMHTLAMHSCMHQHQFCVCILNVKAMYAYSCALVSILVRRSTILALVNGLLEMRRTCVACNMLQVKCMDLQK